SIITSTLEMNCRNCKDEWKSQLFQEFTIEESIDKFLSTFDVKDIAALLRNDFRNYPNNLMRMGGCGIYSL
ncbi:MAG: hypothetical protein LBU51_00765, partial [Bacteroidales bacterium]|nr:hypothetical protein [Bacteroidales bacterium]